MQSKKKYERYWQEKRESINPSGSREPYELLETVGSLLKHSSGNLLDVGSGNGDVIMISQERYKSVYGCDISENACKIARKRGLSVLCADFNNGFLPYKDNSIKHITCIEVIEHIFDPQKLLEELFRLLKRGGRLILTTSNFRYFRHIEKLAFKGSFPHTTKDTFVWGGGHLHYFTSKDLKILLKNTNFKEIRFHINYKQFERSYKRRWLYKITGPKVFAEWFCSGLIVEAYK